jgi:hypothetical protein
MSVISSGPEPNDNHSDYISSTPGSKQRHDIAVLPNNQARIHIVRHASPIQVRSKLFLKQEGRAHERLCQPEN